MPRNTNPMVRTPSLRPDVTERETPDGDMDPGKADPETVKGNRGRDRFAAVTYDQFMGMMRLATGKESLGYPYRGHYYVGPTLDDLGMCGFAVDTDRNPGLIYAEFSERQGNNKYIEAAARRRAKAITTNRGRKAD